MLVYGMSKLLQEISHTESYIDDVIICMKNWDTHLQVLNKLFTSVASSTFKSLAKKVLVSLESRGWDEDELLEDYK